MTATQTQSQPTNAQPTDEETVIKCLGLSKAFRDFWLRNRVKAVDDVNLSVQRGEVYGLLGPNGSGKSTTVKMILGLLHPTAGRIAVFGHHPHDVKMKQQLGYLPEESYLYPFLNARETLDYYGKLFHQNRRQRRERIDMLLEMVGLDKVARRPIGEYSKGMQRRIGLAQALINDPQALILDEPTTGLDPIGTSQIKDLIRQLAERGKTVLLCSHLLADVEDVTDRVAIMFGGRVRKEGTIDELLTQEGITSIQTGELSEADIEAVEQALSSRQKHIERVDHPRQKLESLFLQIVQEAQRSGAATSGAGSGGPIADFLVEEESAHIPEDAEPSQVLSQLMGEAGEDESRDGEQPGSATSPRSPVTEATLEETGRGGRDAGDTDAADADHAVLDELTDDQPAEQQPTEASGRQRADQGEADAEADEADRSVIDSLVELGSSEQGHREDDKSRE
jgi:ABC-2 type transport system ATP-binding protein